MSGEARRILRLGGMLRELLPKPDNVFVRRRPVRVASIAVEHQRVRFQFGFEFFLTECNRLVVGHSDIRFQNSYAVAHESSRSLARA